MGADGGPAGRPLTPTERALLDALLASEFEGVDELREQARRATASTGCECGCVTIDLHVPDDVPVFAAAGQAPVEGRVVDASGADIGGVLLFLVEGRLAGLEVHSDDEPLPFPPAPERVGWETVDRDVGADAPADDPPTLWQRLRAHSA